jgi:hypothetical protein
MTTFGPTPAADATHPGFPLWVKGEYLQRAYRAPGTITNDPFQFGTKTFVNGLPRFVPDPTAKTYFRRPGDSVRPTKTSPFVTPLEAANFVDRGDGTFTPGVSFVDPCPKGAPIRMYFPAAIDANIVYNRAGWHDPNGKLYVEAPPAGATTGQNALPMEFGNNSAALDSANAVRNGINAGTILPEPYTIRSRLGECVNLRTTDAAYLDNDAAWPFDIHDGNLAADGTGKNFVGGNDFHGPTPMTEVSTHVHIVRFDQEGTDGTSVGWNYVQAPLNGQTYGYRWFVDVPLRTVFFHDHQNPNTHQQHGMWSAMNVEPADATWTKPDGSAHTGVGTVANIISPTGTSFREFTVHYSDFVPQVDAAGNSINPPKEADDFGADQGVMAINYKNEPFPIRINSATIAAGGQKAEPAYVFSSAVHGDPSTPIFRAYPNDPVVIRFMDGAHEEEHNFNLAGHRWLHEPDDPNSNLYDSQAMNIAEWFNFEVQGAQVVKMGNLRQAKENMREVAVESYGSTKVLAHGAGPAGDYLYGSQPLNDLWIGMWGIFRVPAAAVSDLKALPNNPAPTAASPWPALKPGDALRGPRGLSDASTPCVTPKGPVLPNKFFQVSAIKQDIVYNATTGDHDPNGVMYTLTENLANPAVLAQPGVLKPGVPVKPLFLRANQGDCVMVTFTNRLPTAGIGPDYAQNGDPINAVENVGVFNQVSGTLQGNKVVGGTLQQVQAIHPAGNRAGMHMGGLARYDVTWNDGAPVGYNLDSSVAPGKFFVYLYYVDTKDMGVVGFENLANLRNTRHHGAWGGMVAEPTGASYLDPSTLSPIKSGEAAVIKYPVTNPDGTTTNKSFREFVVDFQDGLNLFTKAGTRVVDLAKGDVPGAAPDPEDQGEKGVNYRSEPFLARLQRNPDIANVFSSTVHGDPATPVFRAYVGDPVMVRALNSQDLPRTHTLSVFGHEWPHEVLEDNSPMLNAQGGFNTGRAFNLNMGVFGPATGGPPVAKGAGGPGQQAGDYLYLDRNFFFQLSGGLWGIVRVLDPAAPAADLPRLP